MCFVMKKKSLTKYEQYVSGKLPKWLSGSLIRLGPGKFEIEDFQLNHWFDGFAVLYKFTIQDGKVSHFTDFVYLFLTIRLSVISDNIQYIFSVLLFCHFYNV